MTGYELARVFYMAHENTEAMQIGCTGNHHSLYTWICILRNQTQAKSPTREILDLPTYYTMERSFIGSDKTLKKCIDDLANWGLIEIVQRITGSVTKVKLAIAYLRKLYDSCTKALRKPYESSEIDPVEPSHIYESPTKALRKPYESEPESSPEPSHIYESSANNITNTNRDIYNEVVPEKKSEEQSLDDPSPEATIDTAVKTNKAGQMIKPDLPTLTAFVLTHDGTKDMAEAIFDFYTMKGWKVGKDAMKDWNAAARKWVRENKPKQTNQTATRPKKLVV